MVQIFLKAISYLADQKILRPMCNRVFLILFYHIRVGARVSLPSVFRFSIFEAFFCPVILAAFTFYLILRDLISLPLG